MSVVNRIKKIIKKEKLSISAFEKRCGLSNNSIQTAIKRNANLKDVTLNSILNTFPNYNPTWLLTGEGEMIVKPEKGISDKSKSDKQIPDTKIAGENVLLREKVDTLEKQLKKLLTNVENRKAIRKRKMRWYAAAAFVIILAGVLYQSYFRTYSNEDIFRFYYKPFNPEYDNSNYFTQAIFSYKKGEFKNAIELFNQLDSLDHTKTFYLAMSYCAYKEYPKAIRLLSSIKGTECGYIDDINWYLGLSYLKMNDTEKAINEFNAIAKSSSPYKEKAHKVLEDIHKKRR